MPTPVGIRCLCIVGLPCDFVAVSFVWSLRLFDCQTGKEAGVGAQISVSSVRGDSVLWLDDDSKRAACATTAVLLNRMDSFVFGMLGPRLPSLSGLNERANCHTEFSVCDVMFILRGTNLLARPRRHLFNLSVSEQAQMRC